MRYGSEKDLWLIVVNWVTAIVMIACFAIIWLEPTVPSWLRWVLSAISLGGVVVPLWMTYGTWYEVKESEVLMRSGPLFWRLQLEDIESVRPSRSLLAGPALALDRLAVHSRNRRIPVLISPVDRGAFLRDLVSAAPHLELGTEGRSAHRVHAIPGSR